MGLWVEFAQQEVFFTPDQAGQRAVRTLQTEALFGAVLACSQDEGRAVEIAGQAAALLGPQQSLDELAVVAPAILRPGEYTPLALLLVRGGTQAQLIEVDAPPLFLVRRGRPVLLPVVEDDLAGRLLRRCEFPLQEGDHLALVSAEYIRAKGWDRRWGWRDVALALRRLTATGGGAELLAGALVRMYRRLAQGAPAPAVAVIAMHIRPVRRATLWSGPPADPADDARAVARLMGAAGTRIICGDTTAAIAARVLGQPLEQEPRPAAGWDEVPPTWRLAGVDLVTEGVVTLRRTCERLQSAAQAAELPRANDGATRLARLLLAADVFRFLIGTAVNPAQRDGPASWRQEVLAELVEELRARGKVVEVEEVG